MYEKRLLKEKLRANSVYPQEKRLPKDTSTKTLIHGKEIFTRRINRDLNTWKRDLHKTYQKRLKYIERDLQKTYQKRL